MEKIFNHATIDKAIEAIRKSGEKKDNPQYGRIFFDRENQKTWVTDADRLLVVHSIPCVFRESTLICYPPIECPKPINYQRVIPTSDSIAETGFSVTGIDGLKAGKDTVFVTLADNEPITLGIFNGKHTFNLSLLPPNLSEWTLHLSLKNGYPSVFKLGELADFILMPCVQ